MENYTQQAYSKSDPALLQELGKFLQSVRLNQNRTQQAVAQAAGINRSTLVNLEQGHGGTLLSFIQVMRALGQLHLLESFEVRHEISPLLLAEMEMKRRQRASRSKKDQDKPKSTW